MYRSRAGSIHIPISTATCASHFFGKRLPRVSIFSLAFACSFSNLRTPCCPLQWAPPALVLRTYITTNHIGTKYKAHIGTKRMSKLLTIMKRTLLSTGKGAQLVCPFLQTMHLKHKNLFSGVISWFVVCAVPLNSFLLPLHQYSCLSDPLSRVGSAVE